MFQVEILCVLSSCSCTPGARRNSVLELLLVGVKAANSEQKGTRRSAKWTRDFPTQCEAKHIRPHSSLTQAASREKGAVIVKAYWSNSKHFTRHERVGAVNREDPIHEDSVSCERYCPKGGTQACGRKKGPLHNNNSG